MQLFGQHPSAGEGERLYIPDARWRPLWSLCHSLEPSAIPASVDESLDTRTPTDLGWPSCRRLALALRRAGRSVRVHRVADEDMDRFVQFLESCGGFAYRPILTTSAPPGSVTSQL